MESFHCSAALHFDRTDFTYQPIWAGHTSNSQFQEAALEKGVLITVSSALMWILLEDADP